jgi:hypothetical protein
MINFQHAPFPTASPLLINICASTFISAVYGIFNFHWDTLALLLTTIRRGDGVHICFLTAISAYTDTHIFILIAIRRCTTATGYFPAPIVIILLTAVSRLIAIRLGTLFTRCCPLGFAHWITFIKQSLQASCKRINLGRDFAMGRKDIDGSL